MTARFTIPAFAGYGLELEYMIVDRRTLSVRPIADRLLRELAGETTCNVARGELGWSNELVRHVVEIKNVVPTVALDALPARFHEEIVTVNRALEPFDAQLMPTAMHPWMDPRAETVLWEHDGDVYRAYDRIYDCRAHGWANLQSMHVNLPFAGDAEFARLHAAIRLVLPLLPALAASSPFADARATGSLDTRLDNYRKLNAATPSVAGAVIPETVATRAEYEARILAPMYAEIAAHDPAGVLRYEWLNARGAIARFDRDAIEIRLLDIQECPQADVAIAAAVITLVKALYDEFVSPLAVQCAMPIEPLCDALLATIRDAEAAVIEDPRYLATLGLRTRGRAAEIWQALLDRVVEGEPWWRLPVDTILLEGTLARRIADAAGDGSDRERLREVYRALCACLDEGRMFV